MILFRFQYNLIHRVLQRNFICKFIPKSHKIALFYLYFNVVFYSKKKKEKKDTLKTTIANIYLKMKWMKSNSSKAGFWVLNKNLGICMTLNQGLVHLNNLFIFKFYFFLVLQRKLRHLTYKTTSKVFTFFFFCM